MNIERKIKGILSKIIEDEVKLGETLALINNEVNTFVETEISSMDQDMIPKSRFNEVNNKKKEAMIKADELQSQLDELTAKLESSNPEELNTLKAQLETYKKQEYDSIMSKHNKVTEYFNIDETDKDFERRSKLKARFTFKGEGEEDLSIDVIKKNLEVFDILDDAGAITEFKVEKTNFKDKAPVTKTPIKAKRSIADVLNDQDKLNRK